MSRPHTFDRDAASDLLAQGIPIADVARQFGVSGDAIKIHCAIPDQDRETRRRRVELEAACLAHLEDLMAAYPGGMPRGGRAIQSVAYGANGDRVDARNKSGHDVEAG